MLYEYYWHVYVEVLVGHWVGCLKTASLWPVQVQFQLSEECTSGQPVVFPIYMCTSNTEVSHVLPLSFSSGGWCHLISDGNISALKVLGEALVLRPTLFCSTHWVGDSLFGAIYSEKTFVSMISHSQLILPTEICLFHILQNHIDGFSLPLHFGSSLQWFGSSKQIYGELQWCFN